MYPWLTGSASWYLLTLVTEAFGVRGQLGDLLLQPRLLAEQFDARGRAGVKTLFADRALKVVYHNADRLDYGQYAIQAVSIDGQAAAVELRGAGALLTRSALLARLLITCSVSMPCCGRALAEQRVFQRGDAGPGLTQNGSRYGGLLDQRFA